VRRRAAAHRRARGQHAAEAVNLHSHLLWPALLSDVRGAPVWSRAQG